MAMQTLPLLLRLPEKSGYGSGMALVTLDPAGLLAGDNSTHKGEVLAFNTEKGQHLVFYDDGEDEWVDLSLQHVTWHEHARGVTVAHGLPAGDSRYVKHSVRAALNGLLLCPASCLIRLKLRHCRAPKEKEVM